MTVRDKVVAISKASAVSDEKSGTALDDLKLSDIADSEIITNADVLIIFDKHNARVMVNRFSGRKITMSTSNMGGYIKSEIYRIEENASEL